MSENRSSTLTLERDGLIVEVSPQGGSIIRAEFHCRPFLVPAGGPDGEAACFPLLPFGNRIEFNSFALDGQTYTLQPNARDPLVLHGDGWLSVWDIVDASPNKLRMTLSRSADAASPYAFFAEQVIALEHQALCLTVSVTNHGNVRLPFGIGQHPFFVRTEMTQLHARSQRFWGERLGHLPEFASSVPADVDFSSARPLPRKWLNNAYDGWNGFARIVWPEFEISAVVQADPLYAVFMLFAPEHDARYFCLEPMSHLPNGHHMTDYGGLSLLSPGETLSGTIAIHLETLRHGYTAGR